MFNPTVECSVDRYRKTSQNSFHDIERGIKRGPVGERVSNLRYVKISLYQFHGTTRCTAVIRRVSSFYSTFNIVHRHNLCESVTRARKRDRRKTERLRRAAEFSNEMLACKRPQCYIVRNKPCRRETVLNVSTSGALQNKERARFSFLHLLRRTTGQCYLTARWT